MNLTEYLNQKDPKRFVNVLLNKNEVNIYRVNLDYLVHIPEISKIYNIDAIYHVEKNNSTLFTIDKNGCKKSISCFSLNFDPETILN